MHTHIHKYMYVHIHRNGECTISYEYISKGSLILQPTTSAWKARKAMVDLIFFTVHLLHSNSLQVLLIDFIKSLILLSTLLKAEKPLTHSPEWKPSAETEKANSTAQPNYFKGKNYGFPSRRASTHNKPYLYISLAIVERWKNQLWRGLDYQPGFSHQEQGVAGGET